MANYVCHQCGSPFVRHSRGVVRERRKHFCSRICSDVWKRTAYVRSDSTRALERIARAARALIPPTERTPRKRRTKLHPAFGESKTLREWASDDRCVVHMDTIYRRLKRGWPLEETIATPSSKVASDVIEAFGESKTAREWGADDRVKVKTAVWRARIDVGGWDPEEAFVTPLGHVFRGETLEALRRISLEQLQNNVIKPGIEKYLVPLLGYRGGLSLGRVHRLWNFTLAVRAAEAESVTQAIKMQFDPEFAHLCEPERGLHNSSLYSFWSRIQQTKKVSDLEPGLRDYLDQINPRSFTLIPVAVESRWPTTAFWRTYVGRPRRPRLIDTAPRSLFYPYLIHKPKGEGGEWDMLVAINNAVPRGLPDHIRADVCQDICVAILAGELQLEDLKGELRGYIRKVTKMHPLKYGDVSWDAVISSDDDRTFGDVYSAEVAGHEWA